MSLIFSMASIDKPNQACFCHYQYHHFYTYPLFPGETLLHSSCESICRFESCEESFEDPIDFRTHVLTAHLDLLLALDITVGAKGAQLLLAWDTPIGDNQEGTVCYCTPAVPCRGGGAEEEEEAGAHRQDGLNGAVGAPERKASGRKHGTTRSDAVRVDYSK
ncbi:hypothetical protein EJ05DRAFT_488308 [Pseudovirgaria hyperparasitica]|uniref:Uncharacterized protein n=1 Tax=Pseudovirgaria hyperparasitica TaxID=470096 RepID=A0A6A6VY66_9PEZI|nr:uncharacterized protein EJ05DRAFT_488308 [Pseudovirgaria hyperparasitica]KAF2755562.1 hypothetical protein EJ05DRAFT_488308 [Pseudovirgaria hyperparasitica]